MAKQAGILKITGTVNNVCFYKLDSEYYARTKSSLSGKRVKRDPAFAETMKYANVFARGSAIASSIYRLLPAAIKNRKLYQQLTGKAVKMLHEGRSEETILSTLKSTIV